MKLNYFQNAILIFVILTITLFPADQEHTSLLKKEPTSPTTILTASDSKNVSIIMQLNGISALKKETATTIYDCLSVPGSELITREGKPQLPVITKLIAIPDCDDASLSVSVSNETMFNNYNILPAPRYKKNQLGNNNETAEYAEDKNIYSKNRFFPGKYGEVIETGYVRNQKVARVAIYPVQFNPVSKSIKVYTNFSISLSFSNAASSVNKDAGIFSRIMSNTTLNYKDEIITKSSNTTVGSVTRITRLDDLIGSNAVATDYLIITVPSLFNSKPLSELAEHRKNYNQYNVAIIQVDSVLYNRYPGPHYQDIRDYISDVYLQGKANHTGDGHLGYILLVGDTFSDDNSTEMIPAAYPPFYGPSEQASDYYYACTGGDSDDFLDLMYGRLPVGNETELNNIVNKIVSYEYNTSGSWCDNYTFISGSYEYYTNADAAMKQMTEIVPSVCKKSYAYRAINWSEPSKVIDANPIFEQRFTIQDYEDTNKSCGGDKLNDWLYDDPDAGINSGIHTLIYEGHGGWSCLGSVGHNRQIFKLKDNLTPYNNTVQNRLHNSLYSFMIFCACNVGHFDNGSDDGGDCLAEILVNLENRGAIGVLASTRDSDAYTFGLVDGKILEAMYSNQAHIMGEAVMESKLSYGGKKWQRQYNLYGDPATNLWPTEHSEITEIAKSKGSNQFELKQNYPNPFNPSTIISFTILHSSFVTLKIYDILGKEVTTLVNEEKPAGTYKETWNAANLPSGVYFYQLSAGNYNATRKLLFLK